ncbi:PKD domain-containing protein [Aliikangiella sp. IMCC44359]|uniref:PKD domain-containing protein n=1 Tax=Aliikangiella sp. IMCC44359 TaxID=3459125 RepID=UPI00403B1F93
MSHITKKCLLVIAGILLIVGCKDESSSEEQQAQQVELKQTIPFAYVERSVSAQAERYKNQFDQAINNSNLSPLDLHSPYEFTTGASLVVRSGLEVDAVESEVLSQYFSSSDYDVKDLNVSADGKQLIFAARGSEANLTDYTWNIYIYSFESKSIHRVIQDDAVANSGQDTNPAFTKDGAIVFSSDRDAGDPANPRENIDLVGDLCVKVDPIENPSLLHRMTAQGSDIVQLTYGTTNHDLSPTLLSDDRVAFVRWQRSVQPAQQCGSDVSGSFSSSFAAGLNSPQDWSQNSQCQLAKQTKDGPVFITNHYQLLTIDPQTKAMQQLYRTTTLDNSDAAFLALDKLLQIENGNLMTLIRHQFNPSLGGGAFELQPVQGSPNNGVFSEVSPQSITTKEMGLYPEQISMNGWFSAFWPYRDDTSRVLVSWAQCGIFDQGINRFCKETDSADKLDIKYGIWVYNPNDNSKLPVVRVKTDTVFTELAISQPLVARQLSLQAFDENFADNEDGTKIVCNFPNNAPIANAGVDQKGLVGNDYQLNGSDSYDPDGDELNFAWSIVEKPANSNATLSNDKDVISILKPDLVGVYRIQLIVNDGEADSAPDTVNLTVVVADNYAPKADAGIDQSVSLGTQVNLSGANSSDADGDALTYRWKILNAPAQSTVALSSTTIVNPQFTPDKAGNYIIELIVNDGLVNSAPDTVNVIVSTTTPPTNQAPIANAGNDQSGNVGDSFILNGAASSDPDGDALTYRWTIQSKPAGSVASLSNANQVNAGLTTDTEGSYVVQLIVNDGQLDSNVDTVTILTTHKANNKPIANAGADQSVHIGTPVQLSGVNSSDADGDTLTYSWQILNAPNQSNAVLTSTTSVDPQFTPDQVGNYQIQLVVNDGQVDSAPDTVNVIVSTVPPTNQAPIANAGNDLSGIVGDSFVLNGAASSDPDGDVLTYRWSIQSKPTGSNIALTDVNQVNANLVPDVEGNYVIQLIVNDGKLDSNVDIATISVIEKKNTQPIANAGADQNALIGQTVIFDGSASRDPDGDSLTFQWVLTSKPANSQARLMNANSVKASLVADIEGNYSVQLVVNDGALDSAPDSAIAVAKTDNQKPIADAGIDQSGTVGDSFVLDGSASSDPDGDTLSYRWSIQSMPATSSASLVNANQANVSLTPDVEGSYVIQLIVNDGKLDSNADVAIVTVTKKVNTKPVADAGVDQQGFTQQTIIFDGSASSDSEGDSLTYKWSLVSKPTDSKAILGNANSVKASLVADVAGTYNVQLVVNDGEFDSSPDIAIATIEVKNQKPTANAGIDLAGSVGQTVILDGSRSSDPDGDPLTYRWVITSAPSGSSAILNDADKVNPNFIPNVEGDYVVQLVVNDGKEDSDADRVTVSVSQVNLRPVADAGEDQQSSIDANVTLDGSASSDPEGDTLTYRWTILQIPKDSLASLNNATSMTPSLVTDKQGTYEIQLIVNDGNSDSLPDTVIVTAEGENNPPVANAGADQAYNRNESLQLDGSASSDLDGDPLAYRWSIVSPDVLDNIQLTNATSVTPTVVIADDQSYRLQLIVNDGKVDSAPDFVDLTASSSNTRPVADAGDDLCDTVGVTLILSGAGSSDLDGDPLTYQWRVIERPAGSSNDLSNSQIVNPSMTFDVAGRYVVELVVSDGMLLSEPDTVVITIDEGNTLPVANAGEDQSVYVGSQATLDGSASSDPDGDALIYRWSILHKPATSQAQLSATDRVRPNLNIDVAGDYIIQLIVNDGQLESQPDTVMISTFNMRPVAEAGPEQSVDATDLVKLDGSASYDSDGDALTYRWSLLTVVNEPPVIVNAESAQPEVTMNEPGTYIFQLIVNDGKLDSEPDTVSIEVKPAVCDLSDDTTRVIPVTFRDFTPEHPDFEYHNMGEDTGIVKEDLGADGLPVYARSYGSSRTTNGEYYFNQWYRDTECVNLNIPKTLMITRQPQSTIWEYSNSNFFPIDGEGFGNSGLTDPDHNYHFTMETHLSFDYKGGEVFTFRGDDDLWLFINGKLAIDIGGIHSAIERTINLDEIADKLGITVGNRYTFDLFFAERHTTRSNFKFQTNMDLECVNEK